MLPIAELVDFSRTLDDDWHSPVADAAAKAWGVGQPLFIRSSASHVFVAPRDDRSGGRVVLRLRPASEQNRTVLERGARATASWFAAQNPRFSISDLKALDEAQMRKLQEAMSARLGLKPSMISTITIGRAAMDPSPHGNVTVEIRAEEAAFGRGGRVNYEIDGREIKAYLP